MPRFFVPLWRARSPSGCGPVGRAQSHIHNIHPCALMLRLCHLHGGISYLRTPLPDALSYDGTHISNYAARRTTLVYMLPARTCRCRLRRSMARASRFGHSEAVVAFEAGGDDRLWAAMVRRCGNSAVLRRYPSSVLISFGEIWRCNACSSARGRAGCCGSSSGQLPQAGWKGHSSACHTKSAANSMRSAVEIYDRVERKFENTVSQRVGRRMSLFIGPKAEEDGQFGNATV